MASESRHDEALPAIARVLIDAYHAGRLGDVTIPEDNVPLEWPSTELKLAYFALPTSVNYRRRSDLLWQSARTAFESSADSWIFDTATVRAANEVRLRETLTVSGVAMQPVRHTATWLTICRTVDSNWGSFTGLLEASVYDVVELRNLVQRDHKRGFPYLSGPKLFNWWCFLLERECGVRLSNASLIDIAVDSHVLKASTRLGIIGRDERIATTEVANRWREALRGSGVEPVQLNVPLWAWSRSGFAFDPLTK